MKIVHVLYYPAQGGAEQYAYLLAKYAKKNGYDVEFISGVPGPFVKKVKSLGCKVTFIKMRSPFDPFATLSLIQYFRKNRVDIVHTHFLRENFLSIVASKFSPVKGVVSTVHRIEPKSRVVSLFNKAYSHGLSKFIAVSDIVKHYLLNEGMSKDKIAVIYNGVEVEPFDKDKIYKEVGLEVTDKIICNVGRFTPEKGQDVLIEAFAKLKNKDYKLVLVGDGYLLGSRKQQVKNLGIKNRVIFLGGRDNGYEIMGISNIYVQPSTVETFGLSVAEAMTVGVQVIASKIPAHQKILKDGEYGVLFENLNAEDLTIKIDEMIENYEQAAKISKKAKEHALNNFTAQKMWKNTEVLYKQLAKR